MEKEKIIFSRFAPFIRDYIYKSGWETIRKVQVEAADLLFHTENHVLITSSTASGKTEAAIFPMLSMMQENEPSGVGILYIAPLKALINDQFLRIDDLLRESKFPVFHWHGDVSMAHKNKLLKNPAGILQITPESLESMLINRKNDAVRLFGDLRFIILDEIHTMVGTDRGNQVRCCVERLCRVIGHSPRRVGLSATISECERVGQWLSEGTGREASIVDIRDSGVRWRLALEHFFIGSGEKAQDVSGQEPDGEPAEMTNDGSGEKQGDSSAERVVIDAGYEYIYDASTQKKSIIFSNSREETEMVTATMRQIAENRGEDDIFYIHHGNLSASIREAAETVLKNDEKKAVACATVTLELGIDIGRLDRIVNIGATNTATGFLQRLGRSGRRGTPPEMIMVFREETPLPNAPLYSLIPWELLQAVAIIQLYIEERWIEPPSFKAMPFSLIFHQTMSILASGGEMTPKRLASEVLSLPAFRQVEPGDYKTLLISMIRQGFLEQTEENGLIVGLKGERLINSFKFYAVFKDTEEYTVRCGSEEIGTLSAPPPVGDRFALAGKVWEVTELDLKGRLIFVKSVKGKMEVTWPGDKGEIHTRILQRMKKLLQEDTVYPYLKPAAAQRLQEARLLARNTGLLEHPLVSLGGFRYVLFPWLGTRSVRTLKRFLQYRCQSPLRLSNIEYESCYYITFRMEDTAPEEFFDYLQQNCEVDKSALVGKNELLPYEKYDEYIPAELLRKAYYTDRLDETEVREKMRRRFKDE